MGTISIGQQVLECEQVSRGDGDTAFVLEVEYESGTGPVTDRVDLDGDSRMDVTEADVETALETWLSTIDRASIRSFAVYERNVCRRGAPSTESRNRWAKETESSGERSNGDVDELIDDLEFEVGDCIAYYVQGPDSSIYGHVAEGVVERVPPWHRGVPGRGERIVDKVKIDVGTYTKEVPLTWILGPTDDPETAEQVDRPYDTR